MQKKIDTRPRICRMIPVLAVLGCLSCSGEQENRLSGDETGVDLQISWDTTTLRKVSSSANEERYCGYARLAELRDKSWLCIYEADGHIVVVKSTDQGNTWKAPVQVAAPEEGINMAVPDILELNDGSLLACYNPRPFDIHPSRRFAIKTKKSYDGGFSWEDERLLYEAGYRFENGCWEPSAVQLPDGEIQLFFADEGPYTYSGEQHISLLRSRDNGLSWSDTPEVISFRKGFRDGMPSPLLVENGKRIAVAIEDNGPGNFKPFIISSAHGNEWPGTSGGDSPRRRYALADTINEAIYAGAPYLARLGTGEVLLSYQGTEGRENNMNFAEMKVVIGDKNASGFTRKSAPFPVPPGKYGLWNSLAVAGDNTVIALTSTNAFGDGRTEVWMIKGRIKTVPQ